MGTLHGDQYTFMTGLIFRCPQNEIQTTVVEKIKTHFVSNKVSLSKTVPFTR